MWNTPSKKRLDKIPRIGEQDIVPNNNVKVHLHFFIGSCDWYITEYDGNDTFFGFCNLGDKTFAEWGYVSFKEMREISVHKFEVDCENERYFPIQNVEDVAKIIDCPSGLLRKLL